jgi:hypothetical protein
VIQSSKFRKAEAQYAPHPSRGLADEIAITAMTHKVFIIVPHALAEHLNSSSAANLLRPQLPALIR